MVGEGSPDEPPFPGDARLDPRAVFKMRGGHPSSLSIGPRDNEDYTRRLGVTADYFSERGEVPLPTDQVSLELADTAHGHGHSQTHDYPPQSYSHPHPLTRAFEDVS